jgi:hypothetical protein
MRVFSRVKILVWVLTLVFGATAFSARLLADDGKDDKDKSAAASPAKAGAKADSAAAG